jgi:tetratricopeptide (TPR) repeat protein
MRQPLHYLQIALDYYVLTPKKLAAATVISGHFLALAVILAFLGNRPDAVAAATTQPPTSQPQSLDDRIAALVAQLSSDEPNQRQSASAALLALGRSARPAILRASRSEEPILRQQAAAILLQLPWDTPQDSDKVRQLLHNYGNPDTAARRQTVRTLAEPDEPDTAAALSRLLDEDPSPDVRWTIAACLRRSDQPAALNRFRAVPPRNDDPPALAVCGYAWIEVNPDKAGQFLHRCAVLEFASPNDDDGEFDFVIQTLCDLAVADKKFNAAADLRRKQYAHGSPVDEAAIPTALLELFALHANDGPLPGLEQDIKLVGSAMSCTKIQYAMSRLDARIGKKADSDAARAAAFAASTTRLQRYHVGDFLFDHAWDDLAEAEYKALLKMPPDANDPNSILEANAHLRLGSLAAKRGDDLAAAQNKEQAIRFLGGAANLVRSDPRGRASIVTMADIWADVHWHYLRAALARHDEPEVQRRLDELSRLRPTDPEIVIEVVPLLDQRKGPGADAVFDAAFEALKARLDADPQNASLLNGLAWLCARCDRKLADALNWSQQAVAQQPQNAAFLDTLAEVNFRLGHADQAVQLETKALQFLPGDAFMTGQLARFRAASSRPATAPN